MMFLGLRLYGVLPTFSLKARLRMRSLIWPCETGQDELWRQVTLFMTVGISNFMFDLAVVLIP